VCLYTHVEESKDGSASYHFLTNRFRKYPAKSPDGMFAQKETAEAFYLSVIADPTILETRKNILKSDEIDVSLDKQNS